MPKKIYYGWWVVLGASCTLFVCGGIGFASLPVFMKFIEEDMLWGRDSISFAGAISALAAGFIAPLVGFAIDRYSIRRVMLPGAILLSGAFILLSRVNSTQQMYLLYMVTGMGMSATTILPSQTLASRWFEKRRGRAMGIITASGALGAVVWIPVATYLMEVFGWRNTYQILGICIGVISLPFIWLTIRNSPQSMGLADHDEFIYSHEAQIPKTESPDNGNGADYSVRKALGTPSFWLIFCSIFLVAVASSGFGLHMVSFLSDPGSGLSRRTAAIVWSLTIGTSIGGRFLFGYLSEGRQKRYFASAANLFRALSLLLLVFFAVGVLPFTIAIASLVVIYGLALGCSNVVNPLLVSETFGVKAFGSVMGLIGIPFTIGMALGQILAGRLYVLNENYNLAFMLSVIAFVLAGIAISFAKPHFLINARSAKREFLEIK